MSALGLSTVLELGARIPDLELTLFDHTRAARVSQYGPVTVEQLPAVRTRRWYRPESHAFMSAAFATGVCAGTSATRIRQADVILDISGGDSFTDLYGLPRYKAVLWPKLQALRLRKPLILLPQTYGPFQSPRVRRVARHIVERAEMAWARDEQSFASLRELLGDSFDASKHCSGVDVAFLLPAIAPANSANVLSPSEWRHDARTCSAVAGLNVSGLIYNDPDGARQRFGFRTDYRHLIHSLVKNLVARDALVLLVPHVVTPPGHYESDIQAARTVADSLPRSIRDRVIVAPAFTDPREAKWMVGQCDWFCGTRMHAAIAGLSQGVPTSAIAYSLKTAGVFETCEQGREVVDPRAGEAEELLATLLDSYDRRASTKRALNVYVSTVVKRAIQQMESITEYIVRCTSSHT